MKTARTFALLISVFPHGLPDCARTAASKTDVASPARRKITIAWIPKGLNNPVFEVGRLGAIQKAAELSANGPIDVEVLYAGPVNSDGAEQARVVDDVVARGVDAICASLAMIQLPASIQLTGRSVPGSRS